MKNILQFRFARMKINEYTLLQKNIYLKHKHLKDCDVNSRVVQNTRERKMSIILSSDRVCVIYFFFASLNTAIRRFSANVICLPFLWSRFWNRFYNFTKRYQKGLQWNSVDIQVHATRIRMENLRGKERAKQHNTDANRKTKNYHW